MPTNLPPEYFAIEQEYRAAKTLEVKIALLEELMSVVPQHKGTDRLRADLRRRLSKLKTTSQSRKRTGKRESAYHIDRQGAGQVVVVGPTNVGKSVLVAMLTSASPEVAGYTYSTWRPIPAMMPVGDVQVQLIDTPPLAKDFAPPEFMNLVRKADLIALVVDLQGYPIEQLEDSVAVLEKYRVVPLHLRDQYGERKRLTFIPFLVLANKNDDPTTDEDFEVVCELVGDGWPLLPVSGATGRNLERLKQVIFDRLEIIRVYSKPPGEAPDLSAPFVLKRGSTVEELAGKVHQDFFKNLKSARVWGSGVHDGQTVSREHVLEDGDIVELRI
jgi:ribosome-interacting GTPase 1